MKNVNATPSGVREKIQSSISFWSLLVRNNRLSLLVASI
jgi:hypothetical protein